MSENNLMRPLWLMQPGTVIQVPGVGQIGQYDSWFAMLQNGDMGILYFFRDYYTTELQNLRECSTYCPRKASTLTRELKNLHRILSEHEKKYGFPYGKLG
jgi:hypothetical protein